jgi:hypothetical protein
MEQICLRDERFRIQARNTNPIVDHYVKTLVLFTYQIFFFFIIFFINSSFN